VITALTGAWDSEALESGRPRDYACSHTHYRTKEAARPRAYRAAHPRQPVVHDVQCKLRGDPFTSRRADAGTAPAGVGWPRIASTPRRRGYAVSTATTG
jgi:hypothetical protein